MMNSRFRKIGKDLTMRKARTLLTLTGLIIGLWGICTVMIGNAILSNDLAENFTRTNPPDIILNVKNQGDFDLSPILELPEVLTVENRPAIFGRIELSKDNWLPLRLFVVDDFQNLQVAKFYPQADSFPPPPGTMLIERDGELFIKVAKMRQANPDGGHGHAARRTAPVPVDSSSSALQIQLPGGVKLFTEISGTVFDPGQAPSRMELMVYGYVTRETANAWMPSGFRNRLLIESTSGEQEAAQRRQLAEQVESLLNGAGVVVERVILPSPTDHPHQFQMNSILFLLTGLGAMALLMSAVLVLNLINGLLSNQIRQIGSLKAIGATSFQVAVLYLSSMFLLGLAASAIVLPLAKNAGFGLARIIAAMLNFEVLTTELPWIFYAAMVLLGSLFPVTAAFLAVRRWSNVSVRDALENYGVSEQGTGGFSIDAIKLPLPTHLRLGVRNSLRKPKRFLLTVLTTSIGALIFMIAMNTRSSLLRTAEVEEEMIKHDISILFENEVRWQQISWMTQFPTVADVELWQVRAARPLNLPQVERQIFPLIAVPRQTKAFAPNLMQGHWISESQPYGVVANHRFMASNPGLSVGDRFSIEVDGQVTEVEICGVVKEFRGSALYISASGYQKLTGAGNNIGKVALMTLKEKSTKKVRQMRSLLEEHFDLAGLTVTRLQTTRMASRIIRNHLDVIVVMLVVMAVIMLIVSGLGMASGISTSVIERTREVGVLRAIGATPGAVNRILSTESVFMALVGWLIALSIASPVSQALGAYFGIALVEYPFDYQTSYEGVWLCLAVVFLLALVATYGPVKMATRQVVREAVSYE